MSSKLAWPAPLKTMLAGVVLGIVALEIPEVLGIGQDTLRLAIGGETYGIPDLRPVVLRCAIAAARI